MPAVCAIDSSMSTRPRAPFGFPEIGELTGPVRAASVKAGDPHGTSLWAGTAFPRAKAGSAAEIMGELA
jgi:nitronate monooxygenase